MPRSETINPQPNQPSATMTDPQQTTTTPEFSIVIPALNEQGNIRPLVEEIRHHLNGAHTYELIYVDDGSTDQTITELRDLQEQGCRHLHIIRHDRSYGQSAALLSGVHRATAPWIVTLDADGQNDPADIPHLYQAVKIAHERDKSFVCAAGYRKNRQDTLNKRISSKIANAVRQACLDDDCPDTGCGLKIFSRATFLALPFFDHIHRFIPALIKRGNDKTLTVEVNHRPRRTGRSKYGIHNRLWVGIVDLIGVMWLLRRKKNPHYLPETQNNKEKP